MNFDLGAESVSRSYSAGDVVECELEFVLPAKSTTLYWGSDREFTSRLDSYGTNAWQAVADEYLHNTQLNITMHMGILLKSYPVDIKASEGGDVLADFTIKRGGIGHVPVILREVPLDCALKVERFLDGKWVPLESVDMDQNSYYQGVRDANGLQDCVFNLIRPSGDLSQSWRVRIVKQVN